MKLAEVTLKDVILRVLHGQDYRIEIVNWLNAQFLDYTVAFFKQVIIAKMSEQPINNDWYRRYFLDETQPKQDLMTHAGLNAKTITGMHNSARKEIVITAANENYESLLLLIQQLSERDNDMQIELTIRFRGVSVDLNLSESLIVINAIAVKRSQMRGSVWSSIGKQAELPLMLALVDLYNVPETHYKLKGLTKQKREVDFHFINRAGQEYYCEVKLMGKGNPESADAAIARDTQIFIADKLSDNNKVQLAQRNIYWVELRADNGFQRLFSILQTIGVPCTEPAHFDVERAVTQALDRIRLLR